MTQIRITQPGMETFTGMLGEVEFDKGVSVDVVSKMQAQRMRGAFKIETLDGEDPGLLAEIARKRAGEKSPVIYKEPEPETSGEPDVDYSYDEESLMAVADKGGLAGLREFAEPYGAKSNSIVGLIDKLLELKSGE